jgi:hypothetical protein
MISVSLDELEKAVAWLKTNSTRLNIRIKEDGVKLLLKSVDKQDQDVEITIFERETSLLPKISKSDIFR